MPKFLKIILLLAAYSIGTAANATLYNATNADSDPAWHGGNHNHSLWLPGLLTSSDWLINPNNPPGQFDYNEGTGEVSFSGTVTNESDPASSGDFQFYFTRSDTGNPKKELIAAAYDPAPPGGGVNTDAWTYFDFDPNKQSTLMGTSGAIAGLNFVFTQMDNTGGYKGQFGIGANGKNIDLGFSAWLMWVLAPEPNGNTPSLIACPDTLRSCSGHGDINIDLAAVPVPAAFWLFGTALIGFIGFSRRTSI
jgi:hypothetical protein